MDFSSLAQTRTSQRSYDPDRVPSEALIRSIIGTARLAPSAVNRQPWKFHVIRSHQALEKVRAAYTRDWFMDAPCVIAVSGMRGEAWKRNYDGYNSLETDLAIAATFLILAATEQGLGTCWIANFEPEVLREALGLKAGEETWFISPLGYPREPGAAALGFQARGQYQAESPKPERAPGFQAAESLQDGHPGDRLAAPKNRKSLDELIVWS